MSMCIALVFKESLKQISYFSDATSTDGGESGGRKHQVWDNEEDGVAYNWSFFHAMFALATLYIMMTLTNWYE